jgi:hypothetical protein
MTQSELKQTVQHALEQNDLEKIAALGQRNRRVLSSLIRLAYDKETLVGWRAITAIGLAAKALVKTDDEFLRITIRKLLWSLSDESGGIGWSAPEILGEIVSADPEKFSDIIPLIAEVFNVEERVFRPGIVYALTRIAEAAPERVAGFQKIIIMSLVDNEPVLKIHALRLVDRLLDSDATKKLWPDEYKKRLSTIVNNLINDSGLAWIYINDGFCDMEVGECAQKLAENIKNAQ